MPFSLDVVGSKERREGVGRYAELKAKGEGLTGEGRVGGITSGIKEGSQGGVGVDCPLHAPTVRYSLGWNGSVPKSCKVVL